MLTYAKHSPVSLLKIIRKLKNLVKAVVYSSTVNYEWELWILRTNYGVNV